MSAASPPPSCLTRIAAEGIRGSGWALRPGLRPGRHSPELTWLFGIDLLFAAASGTVAFATPWIPSVAQMMFGAALGTLASGIVTFVFERARARKAGEGLRPLVRAATYEALRVIQRSHVSFEGSGEKYRSGAYAEDYDRLPSRETCQQILEYLNDMQVRAAALLAEPRYVNAPLHDAALPMLNVIKPWLESDPFGFLHEYLAELSGLAGEPEFDGVLQASARVLDRTVKGKMKVGFARAYEGDDRGALKDWIVLVECVEDLFCALLTCGWPDGRAANVAARSTLV